MRNVYFLYNYLSRSTFFFRRELSKVLAYHDYDQAQLLERKNEKFLKLLHLAYQKSPFYQAHYDQHGVDIKQIKSLDDITKLPVVTKEDIRLHTDEIKLHKFSYTVKGYTSGTSGTPLTVYRDYSSVIKENAYLWAHRVLFGHLPGMKAVSLRGDLDTKTREKFDPFTNTLYLSSYQLNEKTIDWYFERIADFQPHALYSYPSSIETLCNLFEAKNYQLKVGAIFTSSETVYDFQREKAACILGAPIIDWYGNAERSIALEQTRSGKYQEAPLYSVNEFYHDHLITTSLINNIFPLIRYVVDDVIHVEQSADHSVEIKDIQGRKDDYLVFADGTRVGRMSGTLKGVQHIKYTQFVQDEPCSFVVNVVPAPGFSTEDEALLREKVRSKVGEVPFEVRKVEEDKIIRTKAGKYKLIVNNFSKRESTALV
jgi:phenylacetate-CoA ligase